MNAPAVTWHPGTSYGLVWPGGLAVIDGSLASETVHEFWESLSSSSTLDDFLNLLAQISGKDLLELPSFAVALAAGTGAQVAANGAGVVEHSYADENEELRAENISTWVEHTFEEVETLVLHCGESSDASTYVLSGGMVPAGKMQFNLQAYLAGTPDPQLLTALAESEPAELSTAASKMVAATELPPVPLPHAAIPPTSEPDEQPTAEEDPATPEPDKQPAANEDPATSEPDEQPAADEDPAASDQVAEDAAIPPAPEDNLNESEEELLGEDAADAPNQPVAESVDEPADEPSAPEEPPATTEPENADPHEELASALEAEAAEDELAEAAEPQEETPAAENETPEEHPEAAENDDLADSDPGDHAVTDVPVPTGVQAAICPQGHPNPLIRRGCYVCGEAIVGQPTIAERPSLGRMHTPTGEIVEINSSILAGRAPRLSSNLAENTQLVALPYAHVSGTHIQISIENWDVLALDTDSTNGSYLRRRGQVPQRLGTTPMKVGHGDVIDLGHGVVLVFDGLP